MGPTRIELLTSVMRFANLVATPAGLEPATSRLEGECSIQLSYGAWHVAPRSGRLAIT
jgi:hypothetical protein